MDLTDVLERMKLSPCCQKRSSQGKSRISSRPPGCWKDMQDQEIKAERDESRRTDGRRSRQGHACSDQTGWRQMRLAEAKSEKPNWFQWSDLLWTAVARWAEPQPCGKTDGCIETDQLRGE